MDLSPQVAEEIERRLRAATASCEQSLRVVMAHQSLGEVSVYGRLAATFMAYVTTNVLRPIWKAYPELEPQSMKAPYVEPVAVLAPEADAALRSFIAEASAALAYVHETLSREGSAPDFDFGGLGEIERALNEIQVFREHPRFRDEPK